MIVMKSVYFVDSTTASAPTNRFWFVASLSFSFVYNTFSRISVINAHKKKHFRSSDVARTDPVELNIEE